MEKDLAFRRVPRRWKVHFWCMTIDISCHHCCFQTAVVEVGTTFNFALQQHRLVLVVVILKCSNGLETSLV